MQYSKTKFRSVIHTYQQLTQHIKHFLNDQYVNKS